jgi:S-adenosylmethionine hydrolase
MTDFGDIDPFAGVMKGVIKSIASGVDIVDITHHISPQDILEGSFLWNCAVPYFPDGTIHIGVVDPGVGSPRHPIAARFRRQIFVFPDNGLMAHLLNEERPDAAHIISDPRWILPGVSRTFHGRDIFAPAAAHLASGVAIEELGPAIDGVVRLPIKRPSIADTRIAGEIVRFDQYGNAWTNIPESALGPNGDEWTVRVGERQIGRIAPSYASVPAGKPLAIFASHGHLEIAVAGGSARDALALSRADKVIVESG